MDTLIEILKKHQREFGPVVPFNAATDTIALFDLSAANTDVTEDIFSDIQLFAAYIDECRRRQNAIYLTGGYGERREMYKRSVLFDFEKKTERLAANDVIKEEPRRIHLGVDIWGDAGTKVFAPLGGTVHSFRNNDTYGDYGATIILQHQIEMVTFYTLYGHLSNADLKEMRTGRFITRGECFAHFGKENENGHWPPHLHFQVIEDIDNYEGDYPGVCKESEKEKYLGNSPDADLLLNMMQYAQPSPLKIV